MFEVFHHPQEEIKIRVEAKPEFESFIPQDFKNDPFGYFEHEGKNIKPGEIKYKGTGEISEDPTAVKELPVWKNVQGEEIGVVGKRINAKKSEVRHSGDPFYEYHIMEIAHEFGLPCVKPIVKIEEDGKYLFLTEKAKGIKGFEREMDFLKEKGCSEDDILLIKEQALKMMEEVRGQYDAVGILRKWDLKDMVIDVDMETKTVKSVIPTDFEKTKIDQSRFFEAREKKLKS